MYYRTRKRESIRIMCTEKGSWLLTSVHSIPEKKGFDVYALATRGVVHPWPTFVCLHTHVKCKWVNKQGARELDLANANKFFAPPFAAADV
jgi:hypothetical protein